MNESVQSLMIRHGSARHSTRAAGCWHFEVPVISRETALFLKSSPCLLSIQLSAGVGNRRNDQGCDTCQVQMRNLLSVSQSLNSASWALCLEPMGSVSAGDRVRRHCQHNRAPYKACRWQDKQQFPGSTNQATGKQGVHDSCRNSWLRPSPAGAQTFYRTLAMPSLVPGPVTSLVKMHSASCWTGAAW